MPPMQRNLPWRFPTRGWLCWKPLETTTPARRTGGNGGIAGKDLGVDMSSHISRSLRLFAGHPTAPERIRSGVSIIRTKLASSWDRGITSPPSRSACSCSRSSEAETADGEFFVQGGNWSLACSGQRQPRDSELATAGKNGSGSLVWSGLTFAATVPPFLVECRLAHLLSRTKNPSLACWFFSQSVKVAHGAGRT